MESDGDAVVVQDAADIGKALRGARKRLRLSQQDFADLSLVGVRFLSEVERGKESAEVGRVLRVLQNAGYDVVLRPRSLTHAQLDRGEQ